MARQQARIANGRSFVWASVLRRDGGRENPAAAAIWFKMAANRDHPPAQNQLGYCCYKGEGVERDYTQAAAWFRRAADQGYAPAQCNLGACYKNGTGVPQDTAQAVKWYSLAAQQGSADAKQRLEALEKTADRTSRRPPSSRRSAKNGGAVV